MFQDSDLTRPPTGFKKIEFHPRFKNLIEKKATALRSRDASLDELRNFEHQARLVLPDLASMDALLAIRSHNPSVFQVVSNRKTGRAVGINAHLPLTAEGIDALLSGAFSPAAPLPAHVARPGEIVEAIYVWLTFAPKSFVSTIAGLSEYVLRYAPDGCAMFCRAADERAAKLLATCGCESAHHYYPQAPSDLVVVHPSAKSQPAPLKVTEVKIVRSLDDFLKVMSVRAATYIQEQDCPFAEDYDGNDFCSSHVLGTVDGEPIGCIRIRYFSDFVKFERLAVRQEYRTSKMAFRLVRTAMAFVAQKGFDRVYGHARFDLVRFWETFGFRRIPDRPTFIFSDVEFVEMEGPIKPSGEPVRVGDNPYRILRPEGLWDRPSVFERTVNVERHARVKASLQQARS